MLSLPWDRNPFDSEELPFICPVNSCFIFGAQLGHCFHHSTPWAAPTTSPRVVLAARTEQAACSFSSQFTCLYSRWDDVLCKGKDKVSFAAAASLGPAPCLAWRRLLPVCPLARGLTSQKRCPHLEAEPLTALPSLAPVKTVPKA